MNIVDNFIKIREDLKSISNFTEIIAVSKKFSLDFIKPLIDFGHTHYGENRVKEAVEKWSSILKINANLKIHLVGTLQSNKVTEVFKVFSFIHSLDNGHLAKKLHDEEIKQNKKLKYFIQVNLAGEEQKSGISLEKFEDFFFYCKNTLSLNVIGLMCIPPINSNPEVYFNKLKDLANKHSLKELSMGMSNDFKLAAKYGSTFVRIGTGIFGARN